VALSLSHGDLQRASLAKNRAVLDPLTRSFEGTSLEERAVLHYGGEEGEKLARLLTKTDLKAVLATVPKAERAEDFEAALDRNLSAPWRARRIIETEHHAGFSGGGGGGGGCLGEVDEDLEDGGGQAGEAISSGAGRCHCIDRCCFLERALLSERPELPMFAGVLRRRAGPGSEALVTFRSRRDRRV